MVKQACEKLPDDTITIRDGLVMEVKHWTLWNGAPWNTIHIERKGVALSCSMSTPDGGGCVTGDIETIVKAFHGDVGVPYRHLFSGRNMSDHEIRALGFLPGRCKIMRE